MQKQLSIFSAEELQLIAFTNPADLEAIRQENLRRAHSFSPVLFKGISEPCWEIVQAHLELASIGIPHELHEYYLRQKHIANKELLFTVSALIDEGFQRKQKGYPDWSDEIASHSLPWSVLAMILWFECNSGVSASFFLDSVIERFATTEKTFLEALGWALKCPPGSPSGSLSFWRDTFVEVFHSRAGYSSPQEFKFELGV